jgi:hypothetical protein
MVVGAALPAGLVPIAVAEVLLETVQTGYLVVVGAAEEISAAEEVTAAAEVVISTAVVVGAASLVVAGAVGVRYGQFVTEAGH